MGQGYLKLPKHLLDISILSGNERGWRKNDVLDVIEAARQVPIGTIGGQVQYITPTGTCELYWLSYDSAARKSEEDWITYCNRSAFECSEKFKRLLTFDIRSEAIKSFPDALYHDGKVLENLDDYQVFIFYFDDKG